MARNDITFNKYNLQGQKINFFTKKSKKSSRSTVQKYHWKSKIFADEQSDDNSPSQRKVRGVKKQYIVEFDQSKYIFNANKNKKLTNER